MTFLSRTHDLLPLFAHRDKVRALYKRQKSLHCKILIGLCPEQHLRAIFASEFTVELLQKEAPWPISDYFRSASSSQSGKFGRVTASAHQIFVLPLLSSQLVSPEVNFWMPTKFIG